MTFLPWLHGVVSGEDRSLAKAGASGEGRSLDVFTVAARVVSSEDRGLTRGGASGEGQSLDVFTVAARGGPWREPGLRLSRRGSLDVFTVAARVVSSEDRGLAKGSASRRAEPREKAGA